MINTPDTPISIMENWNKQKAKLKETLEIVMDSNLQVDNIKLDDM